VQRNDLESTARLLALVRAGDARARERLAGRYIAALRRFAHGRLPAHARDLLDTDDLVQVTVIRALEHVETFEPRHEGAFLAYLRQILLNQLRDEVRRVARRPARAELDERLPLLAPSPLEEVIGKDAMERYEAAMAHLSAEQREAVVLRIELGFGYSEIAEAMDRPSGNAARMLVTRALVRLAKAMNEARGPR
jgi:RNA polymerase sigma factor (sigma-70 family)